MEMTRDDDEDMDDGEGDDVLPSLSGLVTGSTHSGGQYTPLCPR